MDNINEDKKIANFSSKEMAVIEWILIRTIDALQENPNRHEIKGMIQDYFVDFCYDDESDFFENLAMCDESVMEQYLDSGEIDGDSIARLIRQRKVFPCFFGSGLKTEGVEDFLRALESYALPAEYGEEFSARV